MSATLAKFYRIFWNDSACREIFLNHKEQLLEKEVIDLGKTKRHFYFQRIVISNSLKYKRGYNRLLQRIENRNIDIQQSLQNVVERNVNQEKIESYFKSKLQKPIAKITKKLNGSNFTQIRFLSELTTSIISEERFLKFLKKYELIPDSIQTLNDIGDLVTDVFNKELPTVIKSEHFVDVLDGLNNLSAIYNNQIFESLMSANELYADILYEDEDFRDRLELFDDLYEAGVLEAGKFPTYYECTSCDIGVFSGNMLQKIKPSKLKMKCLNCNKQVFYLAPYIIHKDLYQQIIHKDGLLFFAIQNLLTEHEIGFYPNLQILPDVELDLAVGNEKGISSIIEVKMFKKDRPFKTQLGNMRTAANQLLRIREKLIESPDVNGFENITYYLVTNLSDPELISALADEMKSDMVEAKMSILSPDDFLKLVRTTA